MQTVYAENKIQAQAIVEYLRASRDEYADVHHDLRVTWLGEEGLSSEDWSVISEIEASAEEVAEVAGIADSFTEKAAYEAALGDTVSGKWKMHLVMPGCSYGLSNSLVYDVEEAEKYGMNLPMVEFYDMSVNPAHFPNGQFVARYYMSTILGLDGWGTDIADRAADGGYLDLQGDVPSWKISGVDLVNFADALWEAYHTIEIEKSVEDKSGSFGIAELAATAKEVEHVQSASDAVYEAEVVR